MVRTVKHHIMGRSREKKYQQFLRLTSPDKKTAILDVGTGDKEYSPFDNYLEKGILFLK